MKKYRLNISGSGESNVEEVKNSRFISFKDIQGSIQYIKTDRVIGITLFPECNTSTFFFDNNTQDTFVLYDNDSFNGLMESL